jgi:hypothetical protein
MKRIFIGATCALLGAVWIQAADARIDVSSVIDKATAESLLGEKIKDLSPRNGDGKDGYYSKCNYYSVAPGKTLLIRVYQAAQDYSVQGELDFVTKDTPKLKEVSGIGDKAMVTDGTASALPARTLMLYVAKGNAFLTIGLSGFDDDSIAMDKAKTIAQKLLEHL